MARACTFLLKGGIHMDSGYTALIFVSLDDVRNLIEEKPSCARRRGAAAAAAAAAGLSASQAAGRRCCCLLRLLRLRRRCGEH